MKNIYIKAISEALKEKVKAEATVSGLLKVIASEKRNQLEEFIKKTNPYKSKGFVLAKTSYDVSSWGSHAFSVSAEFILKDIEIPSNATTKEINLLKEYKNLIKKIDWKWENLEGYAEIASKINSKLYFLKNKIEVYVASSWSYDFSDVQREDIFTRGFSFERRDE